MVAPGGRTAVHGPRPPGPRGLPVIGNLEAYERDRLGFLTMCAREFGDVVRFSDRTYFVNSPALIEQILSQTNRTFAVMFNLFRRPTGTDQSLWLRQRRSASRGLQHSRVARFAPRIVAQADTLTESWVDGDSRVVLVDMERLTSRIIAEFCFGNDAVRVPRASAALLDALFPVVSRPVLFPPTLPTPSNLRVRRRRRELVELMHGIIGARAGTKAMNDLLGTLLTSRPALSDRLVAETLIGFLLAAHTVPAAALAWTWYLLARHPAAEQRMHEELRARLGARGPTADDIDALPYTTAVIKEAMRLYPPTWMAARKVVEPCRLGGYALLPGQGVMISSYVMHRDPRWHPDPEQFWPERWIDGTTQELPRCAYLPFGSGSRVCPGAGFAMAEMVLVTAAIGRRARLRLPPGQEVRPDARRTLLPTPSRMIVEHYGTP